VGDVAKQLAQCLDYARVVNEALPVDEEADRMAERMLRDRDAGQVKRKLLPRSR
jgi:hypothetical protein